MVAMAIAHPGESRSNEIRRVIGEREPVALRTFTPTQLAISRSAGVFHWTADGRRLYDYTSGVLVANLGHNPKEWQRRFFGYMGWEGVGELASQRVGEGFFEAVPLTAYNAITAVEREAVTRLLANLRSRPGGKLARRSSTFFNQSALWRSWSML